MQEANSDLCATAPTCHPCEQQGGLLWTMPAEAAALHAKSLLHVLRVGMLFCCGNMLIPISKQPSGVRTCMDTVDFHNSHGLAVPAPPSNVNVLQVHGTCSACDVLRQHILLNSTGSDCSNVQHWTGGAPWCTIGFSVYVDRPGCNPWLSCSGAEANCLLVRSAHRLHGFCMHGRWTPDTVVLT